MKRGGYDFASVAPLYNDLVQRGFSPIHAAAIAGNFAYESGPKGRIDYGAQELKPTAGRGGFGAAQWTGPRRVGLEQFARKNGLPLADRETQMKYFDQERTGSERGAFNKLQKTGDINSATKAFMQNYERPRASTANLPMRQQYAQEILARAQRGDYNMPGETQYAKNETPLPPQRPAGLPSGPAQAPTQIARNDAPPPGSVLNRINPNDPSGPLLPETAKGYFEQRYAQDAPQTQLAQADVPMPPSRPGDLNQTMTAQNAPMPPSRPEELNQTLMSDTPLPPTRPEGLSPAPTMMADTPMMSRPSLGAPAPVQVAQQSPSGMSNMLMEPQGGGGGAEGFASSAASPMQMAQASPEMFNPQMMGAAQPGGFNGGLGGLFADAFMPAEMPQTQFADAGTDFGGGGGFGGFDLGSIFA